MKGLILKDIYMIRKYCVSYLFLLIIFLFSGFVSDNTFFLAYPCILVSMIPMSLYTYDDKEQFCAYFMTLPVSREQYVSAKYLLGIVCTAVGIVLTSVSVLINALPPSLIITVLALSLVVPSFSFPFLFKFGPEKGRLIYMTAVAVASALSFAAGIDGNAEFTNSGISAALLVIFAFLIYFASWFISVKLYNNRSL